MASPYLILPPLHVQLRGSDGVVGGAKVPVCNQMLIMLIYQYAYLVGDRHASRLLA